MAIVSPRKVLVGAALAAMAAGGLSACATAPGPYDYAAYETGRVARVEEGTIVAARPIVIGGSQQGSGAAVGGLAGAAVGSQFGGDTGGHLAGALLGAIGGAVVGDSVQRGQTQQGVAYTVRRAYDGTMIEVAQPDPRPLAQGTRVHIVYGERVRITPAG